MNTGRISTLLQPFLDRLLAPVQLDQISTYIDLLLRWNARINLTAVRDPESIVTRHFGESLFLARHLFPPRTRVDQTPGSPARAVFAGGGATLLPAADGPSGHEKPQTSLPGSEPGAWSSELAIDIGSGAGFPALPLKIWDPHISLTMIESNHKKAAFLREVARALTLTDINVISERAETLVGRLPAADLVTLRAVERFEDIVPTATRFLAPTGRLALLIGAAQFSTLARLTPEFSWQPPIPIPSSESRVVAISEPRT